jgi:Holliday junction resolvase RusA-like endonuclease
MIQFTVFGTPIPKGSTRSFAIARGKGASRVYTGKTVNMASNADELRPWEALVRDAATQAGAKITSRPVEVNIVFSFRRPKGHFRKGKNANVLRDGHPEHHTSKPDLDKLERAILDGLTGVVYVDDSQVVCANALKQWLYGTTSEPRSVVEVEYL